MTIETDLLSKIAQRLGGGVERITFQVVGQEGATRLEPTLFTWTIAQEAGDRVLLLGRNDMITVGWEFAFANGGCWVTLSLQGEKPLACTAIDSLIIDYKPAADNLLEWWALNYGNTIHSVGLFRVHELTDQTRRDKLVRGLFADPQTPGLFLGTKIPQEHEHLYTITPLPDGALCIVCTTQLTPGVQSATTLTSETTWVCATKTVSEALTAYAAHLPLLQGETGPGVRLPIGWNSWDYYFTTVSLEDVIENMESIRADPHLSQQIKYIVVDHGWQHVEGEWFPNYRFPGGLERLVAEITNRGFVPGIWTAPILVDHLSKTALRQPELLLKNAHGDPVASGHWYLLDPTHPAGEAFVGELYSRLFQLGFRFFKVDYVDALTADKRYYQQSWGPYRALRHLFTTIRAAVTDQSHILGCALPAECGPGYADSGRFGIDIHNQWAHVEWVCDYLQLCSWQHGRIWINDPDFLIVRGADTSWEAITNVTNPNAHHPTPPRWRRGLDFTWEEAHTWVNLVMLTGGSVFLSDRLRQLNAQGRQLLTTALEPTGIAAQPLDLCAGRRATLWLQKMSNNSRLTVINWDAQPVERIIEFSRWGLTTPQWVRELKSQQALPLYNGQVTISLPPHASRVLEFISTH